MWTSHANIVEIPMGLDGMIGIEFKVAQANKVEERRQCDGGLLLMLNTLMPKKAVITMSGSGAAMRSEPAFELMQLGSQVTIWSPRYVTAVIPAGQTSVTVSRDIVPGSIVPTQGLTTRKPGRGAFAGRVISIPAAVTEATIVRYRQVYVCRLKEHSGTASEVEATQTWDGTFPEI